MIFNRCANTIDGKEYIGLADSRLTEKKPHSNNVFDNIA
jgi:hypothetical protein